MKDKNLFKIGEIADIYSVSVQTLRHYENIGILKPEYIDPETNYRYYSYEQTEVLNTIRYLRLLDTPLPTIKSFLQERNIESMEDILNKQEIEVSKKIQSLQIVQKKIQRRKEILQKAKKAKFNQIEEYEREELQYVWVKQEIQPSSYLDLESSIMELEKNQKETLVFLGNVGIGKSIEHLLSKEYEPYDSVFILLDPSDNYDGTTHTIPSSKVISITFKGKHSDAQKYYLKLQKYMKENNLTPSNFSREITLIDEGLTNDSKQFVTQIEIPVKKGSNK